MKSKKSPRKEKKPLPHKKQTQTKGKVISFTLPSARTILDKMISIPRRLFTFVGTHLKLMIVLIICLLVIGGLVTLYILQPVVAIPQLGSIEISSSTTELTNSNSYSFTSTGNKGIIIEHDGKSIGTFSNTATIENVKEGLNTYYVYRGYDLFFLVIRSSEFKTFNVTHDYTPPILKDPTNVSNEIYKSPLEIKFGSEEDFLKVVRKLNDEETIIFDDSKSEDAYECTFTKDENNKQRTFTCPVKFETEGEYVITFYVEDRAGNRYYFYDNQSVKYVNPITLGCKFPNLTNKTTVSSECTPNKDGKYILQEKETVLKTGVKFTLTLNLSNEGENLFSIDVIDNENRKFTEEFKIIRDTNPPVIDILNILTNVGEKGPIPVNFKVNEDITGTISIIPVGSYKSDNYTKYTKVGKISENISLKKDEQLSKSYSTKSLQICYTYSYEGYSDSDCYIPNVHTLVITVIDGAGNKKDYSATIFIN